MERKKVRSERSCHSEFISESLFAEFGSRRLYPAWEERV